MYYLEMCACRKLKADVFVGTGFALQPHSVHWRGTAKGNDGDC